MDPKKAMRKERAAVRRDERDNFKREMDMLMKDPARTQLEFPASLQKSQRKQLHRYATRIGLKSRSTGTGAFSFSIFVAQFIAFNTVRGCDAISIILS